MLERCASFVWGPGLMVLLLGTGLYLSVHQRFFQLTHWRMILRRTFGQLLRHRTADASTQTTTRLSQFQTFSTALAAAMGTGNIIGVAAALAIGGAGAVFWMWISALLGMMLTYTENVLGMAYARTLPSGKEVRGPMAYLRFGLNSPLLAAVYAGLCVAASFGMGNMAQSSAVSELTYQAFALPHWGTALLVWLVLGYLLWGGMRRVGRVVQWVMPILSGVYLLGAIWVIVRHGAQLPAVCRQIFCQAWGVEAVDGGVTGAVLRAAIRTGLRHGIFSNEAGLGSSALVHAGGDSQDGVTQGLWSMVEVALDTLVCCTLTALAVLTSGVSLAQPPGKIVSETFSSAFGAFSPGVMAVLLSMFAFCSLVGWSVCGEQAVYYLGGKRAVQGYRVLYGVAAGLGCMLSLSPVWALSDIANGCMAVPNLLGLLVLGRKAAAPTHLPKADDSLAIMSKLRKKGGTELSKKKKNQECH